MRNRSLIIAALIIVVGCAMVFGLRRTTTTAQPDLSVTFIGLTNDPGRSVYPALSVLSDGIGLHALFAVTNTGQQAALQFGIMAVETQRGTGSSVMFPTGFKRSETEGEDGWRATEAGGFFTGPLGMQWCPGHGCVYAVRWPTAVNPSTPWRLRLWVRREPNLYLTLVNQRLHRELFGAHGDHTVTSSVVHPFKLLSDKSRKPLGGDGATTPFH